MTDHRRLKIDARKWVVARMLPKKYGDKIDITTDNKPINNISLTDEEKKKVIDSL